MVCVAADALLPVRWMRRPCGVISIEEPAAALSPGHGDSVRGHIERDELGAPQRAEEADEQQRPVAQGAHVAVLEWRHDAGELVEAQRAGAEQRPRVETGDAGAHAGDGRMPPVEPMAGVGVPGDDRRQRALDAGERAAFVGERGEVGTDRLGRGGQRRRAAWRRTTAAQRRQAPA